MAQALRPQAVLLDVMVTAHAQPSDPEAGRQAGCDADLTKPFSPLELIGAVASLVPAR